MNRRNVKSSEKITQKQAVAYGIIAVHTLLASANKIDELEIGNMMITIMELHTPKEAEERANILLMEARKWK